MARHAALLALPLAFAATDQCSLTTLGSCVACPDGARCATYDPHNVTRLEVRKGYWRASAESAKLLLCPRGEAACPGDRGAAAGAALAWRAYGEDFLLWVDEKWDGEEKFKRL